MLTIIAPNIKLWWLNRTANNPNSINNLNDECEILSKKCESGDMGGLGAFVAVLSSFIDGRMSLLVSSDI